MSGKGSGAWGEGVLRPQMTGGVWLGAGSGGGWGDPSTVPVRPQLTGGAFIGSGGSRIPSFGSTRPPQRSSEFSPECLPSHASKPKLTLVLPDAIHGAGKDAFAELDPDIILTGRNRPESGPSTPTKEGASNGSGKNGLPDLPSVPLADVDAEKAAAAAQAASQNATTDLPSQPVPDFPDTPSSAPKTPAKPSGAVAVESLQGTPDTSIEIGVHSKSPEELEKLRERARDLDLNDSPLKAERAEALTLRTENPALAGEIPQPLDKREIAIISSSPPTNGLDGSQDSASPSAATLTNSTETTVDAVSASSKRTADPNESGDLPQRAHVERTVSGKVDAADPGAHKVMGPGLLVPRDEVAEARDVGQDAVKAPLLNKPPSTHSRVSDDGFAGVGAAMTGSAEVVSDSDADSLPSPDGHRRHESEGTNGGDSDIDVQFPIPPTGVSHSISNGTITASGSASTLSAKPATPATPNGAARSSASTSASNSPAVTKQLSPAERARQAVAQGRSKSQSSGSQRLKRPPPGKVFSTADLDASDEDYEPGWASVISSSRS